MAVVLIGGFEVGSLKGEPQVVVATSSTAGGVSVGSVSLERVIVRTGAGSIKLTPASAAQGFWEPNSAFNIGAPVFIRFYLRVTQLPAVNRLVFGDVSSVNSYGIKLNTDGTLGLFKSILVGNSAVALTDTSRWYRVELKVTAGSQELRIDGVSQVTDTNATPGATRLAFGAVDTVASTYTAYVDDYCVSNSAYPGPGNVVLLVPISDNGRSALWTAGGGGTTNLWRGVDNKPPTGTTAALETNVNQIKHAGGATGSYDATMTPYSTAGIGAGDTINAVMPFIWHGEASATGHKLLTFNILSNPATVDSGSFDVSPTATAMGVWPTNWFVRTAPLGGAPGTLNSPVMRVTRPETATREADVCFMGIYVDYTPATASPKRMKAMVLGP